VNIKWNNESEILLDYSHSSNILDSGVKKSEYYSLQRTHDVSEGLALTYLKEIRKIYPIFIAEVFNICFLYQNTSDCYQMSDYLKTVHFICCYYCHCCNWYMLKYVTKLHPNFTAWNEVERIERSAPSRHEGTFGSRSPIYQISGKHSAVKMFHSRIVTDLLKRKAFFYVTKV